MNGSLQDTPCPYHFVINSVHDVALCVAAAHMDHFDHAVINSVAASVHYVNGINNYFIIVKATESD